MQIVPNNKKSTFLAKIICRELLQLFRASQFGLVYTLNVALVFFVLGALVSFFLINSGNFFIDIVNFLLKKLAIPDGYYHGSYSLSGFFWYSYLFITLIIYIAEKLWCKKFGKDDIIISVKYKIIA
ncbi:MAG: hypothetical protein NT094_05650, partial [Candidatus Staskawiczbacteria bacterium]|nr:hypothetical protein [Candidatus Staskawiczbacteria bacterium]